MSMLLGREAVNNVFPGRAFYVGMGRVRKC